MNRIITEEERRKWEILVLYINGHRVSEIQRVTRKRRGTIKRYIDWFRGLAGTVVQP